MIVKIFIVLIIFLIIYKVVENKKRENFQIEYIRKSLKNDFIKVKIDSNKSIKKNILFTPTEKFEKLVEINPSLEILRKKLDLDY